MNNKNTKTTSITLRDKQVKFFDEKRINVSHFIRDLIEDSEEYKKWEDHERD